MRSSDTSKVYICPSQKFEFEILLLSVIRLDVSDLDYVHVF